MRLRQVAKVCATQVQKVLMAFFEVWASSCVQSVKYAEAVIGVIVTVCIPFELFVVAVVVVEVAVVLLNIVVAVECLTCSCHTVVVVSVVVAAAVNVVVVAKGCSWCGSNDGLSVEHCSGCCRSCGCCRKNNSDC